jgi:hypothetical protein
MPAPRLDCGDVQLGDRGDSMGGNNSEAENN